MNEENTKNFKRVKHRGGIGYLIAFLRETNVKQIDVSKAMGFSRTWCHNVLSAGKLNPRHIKRLHALGKFYEQTGRLPTTEELDQLHRRPVQQALKNPVRINFDLDRDQWRDLKHRATDEGKSVAELLRHLIAAPPTHHVSIWGRIQRIFK